MSNLPELCVVDTNVPVTANKKDQELELCILSCREAIQHA